MPVSDKPCAVEGCLRKRPLDATGVLNGQYCGMHHMRLHRLGYLGPSGSLREIPRSKGYVESTGYKRFHTLTGKRPFEHRVVWDAVNGPIPPKHQIHHINGDKLDNRIENLQCLSVRDHRLLHLKERTNATY
jgi:hypothetical protein